MQDEEEEQLRLALELSLVESSARQQQRPYVVDVAPNAELRDEEEERLTRLAQMESEKEYQEYLEQKAVQRALRATTPSSSSLPRRGSRGRGRGGRGRGGWQPNQQPPASTTTTTRVDQWTSDDVRHKATLWLYYLNIYVNKYKRKVMNI
jgi:hypothetical protein